MSKIAVLIPAMEGQQKIGLKTIKQLSDRAGIEADYFLLFGQKDGVDFGYINKVNHFVSKNDYDYYVYTAIDAFAGKNWLKIAWKALESSQKGLFAFNDGKWDGKLASFGMVKASWKSPFFFDGYHSHYGDAELTELAKMDDQLAYDPRSVLVEVDYDKHGVNLEDKKLFRKRNLGSEFS